jgi:mannan endo-1,4-beta-mannosidase
MSFYNAAAAKFVTTGATTAVPVASGGGTSGSGSASASKTALLSYIDSLVGKSGKHILIGQHSNYWDAVPTDDITGLIQQTGKTPAIIGLQFDTNSPEGIAGGQYSGVTLANTYLSQGNIVLITEVPGSPLNGTQMWGDVSLPDSPIPGANFMNMTIPGTAEYNAFQTYLAKLSSTLAQIKGPVLFRPFAEQNGTWFWYGNQNPAQFIKMWQMMWNYVTNTAGLTNVIWVYATNAGMGNYSAYYPGSQYADIVGEDAYPPSAGDAEVWQELGTLGKPEIYAESGASLVSEQVQFATDSLNNDSVLSLVEHDFPQIVAVISWCQSVALDNQLGASAVMNDPQVITLSDLPSGL